jgi:hypothetical protein
VISPLLFALFAPAPAGPPVVVTATVPNLVLYAGERGEVEVVATIRRGFRIQANPASEPFLVPALLEIEADDRVHVDSPEYPPGKPYRLQGTAADLSVYEGRLVIRVPVTARRRVGTGSSDDVVLEGRLRYQACNEHVCLRPSSVPVRARVSLRPRASGESATGREEESPE